MSKIAPHLSKVKRQKEKQILTIQKKLNPVPLNIKKKETKKKALRFYNLFDYDFTCFHCQHFFTASNQGFAIPTDLASENFSLYHILCLASADDFV